HQPRDLVDLAPELSRRIFAKTDRGDRGAADADAEQTAATGEFVQREKAARRDGDVARDRVRHAAPELNARGGARAERERGVEVRRHELRVADPGAVEARAFGQHCELDIAPEREGAPEPDAEPHHFTHLPFSSE